jgi:hypothetical protein
VRIADFRPYDPPLPSGETPRERIVAAARHRFAADHRAVTRVRVLDGPTGAAPYDLDVLRQWHEHSRRRHCQTLTTIDAPLARSDRIGVLSNREFVSPHQTLWALFHYNRVYADGYDLPLTSVVYHTDGTLLYDFDAPAPDADRVRISGGDDTTHVGSVDRDLDWVGREFVRPHRTDWERVDDGDGLVTYRVSGPDAYAQVIPLPFAPVSSFRDCRVDVSLDESGRLRRVVDNRAVVADLGENLPETPLTYRIETVIDQYGRTTVRRPSGAVDRSPGSHLKGLLTDLLTY